MEDPTWYEDSKDNPKTPSSDSYPDIHRNLSTSISPYHRCNVNINEVLSIIDNLTTRTLPPHNHQIITPTFSINNKIMIKLHTSTQLFNLVLVNKSLG